MQWIAFTIAGAFAALAGALYAFLKGSVFPDDSGDPAVDRRTRRWSCSAASVRSSGGVVGAALYNSLSIWVISHTDYSKLVLGVLIIVLVVAVSARPRRLVRGLAKRAAPSRRLGGRS